MLVALCGVALDEPAGRMRGGLAQAHAGEMQVASTVADQHRVAAERTDALDPMGQRDPCGVPQQKTPRTRGFGIGSEWWLWVDSNHRPQHYECCALTG